MTPRTSIPTLRRRLLGYYLLFGLAAVAALAAGWLALEFTVLRPTDDADRLSRIQTLRALIIDDLQAKGGTGSQTLVQLLAAEDWVASAAVVDPQGQISAHSNASRIGKTEDLRLMDPGSPAIVERKTILENGHAEREYCVPLISGGRSLGTLQVCIVPDNPLGWLHSLVEWGPYPLAASVVILGFGAGCLARAARTSGAIEQQLRAASAAPAAQSDLPLKPIADPGPDAAGWNRLVERALAQKPASGLDARLASSLAGLQERRSDRILNSLTDGVALTDAQGGIAFANRALGALLGQTADPAQLRGQPLLGLLPESAAKELAGRGDGGPQIIEAQIGPTLADGVLRIARVPLAGDDAAAGQHVWTVRDVTQQKLSDEMRNQFVYSATHELRTPLTNIRAYAETLTLNEIADPEQQKGFLNVINSEATRLARFVEELLNVSQMEAGSLTLARSEVDLERLLGEVSDKVRSQMVQKRIEYEVQFPPKLPKVHVDKDKFIAALVNLLGNAAKYTPDGGRVTFRVVSSGRELQFVVEDTGIGISAEELPKLFTKFFRSADERVRDVPGSGLGLAFSQEIARLHGGKLSVHSELNKGSQFTLSLPIG